MKKSIYSKKQQILLTWLKEQREAQGFTMRDLGAKLKVPHTLVGKVEQGERRLDVVEFVEYCAALDLDAKEGLALIIGKTEKTVKMIKAKAVNAKAVKTVKKKSPAKR